MKHIIIVFLFVQSLFVLGQNDAKSIAEDSRAFMHALEEGNYEYFLDIAYPGIFEVYERDVFLEALKEAMEGNAEIKTELLNTESTVFDISEIYSLKRPKTKYAFVTYPTSMKVIFLNESFDEDMQEIMKIMMQTEYMKIEFLNENSILVNQKSMLIAINNNKTKQTWKYINYDPAEFELLNILPVELINKAKTHYKAYLSGNER
jgi:hypothetical protein